MQSIKALLFGILLVLSGTALMFTLPQLIIVWQATIGEGNSGASPVPLLISSICSVIVILSGLLIGYRGYIRPNEEA